MASLTFLETFEDDSRILDTWTLLQPFKPSFFSNSSEVDALVRKSSSAASAGQKSALIRGANYSNTKVELKRSCKEE